jgi:hypothetical protein
MRRRGKNPAIFYPSTINEILINLTCVSETTGEVITKRGFSIALCVPYITG